MIKISNAAQNYFLSLLSKEPVGTQIRVFIINPGMSNAECRVAYCAIDEIEESDVKLKYNNFYIYINKSIMCFLKNSEIDLIVDKLNSQLTFKAPYATKNILNTQLSLQEKIKNFLNVEINPQLSLHGGKVNLINISDSGIAVIEFTGGCNGCSMIGVTLKEMIEKKILSFFPEIKKVIDQTHHLHGHHSFY
ncbi:NfuA family Fe-S biogenesis protein [Buchnera aphidicola (Aphis helianthi)]|uniref:Fe/S biogenesis protein NfuA n=1 Tax=Buchnera aphidicola (Aphis helianthi) TaxID=2315802 RepID=A0A4D6XKS9_9GAMM|nr:NfuA family Fe-S biogenesis protein [Buchnera aphidicola]QCI17342.1 NfuA family Fe-S biogenesis protein [Buchnera aphidicola (Aphis helianthi)]